MKKVNFTQMKDGSKEEYLLLDKYEQEYIRVDILNIEKDLKLFDQNEKAALKEKDRIY